MQQFVRSLIPALLAGMLTTACGPQAGQSRNAMPDTATVAPDTTAGVVQGGETAANGRHAGPGNNPAPDTSRTADWLLLPGAAAGNTAINSDAGLMYKRLGTPDAGDAAMMKAVAVWYSNHDTTAHSTAIFTATDAGNDPVPRVKLIRVTSPRFQTRAGLGPGSTLPAINRQYALKQTETYRDAGSTYTVYDSPEGIAFETAPDGTCVAVVIHEPGIYASGIYAKFRLTNKYFRPAHD